MENVYCCMFRINFYNDQYFIEKENLIKPQLTLSLRMIFVFGLIIAVSISLYTLFLYPTPHFFFFLSSLIKSFRYMVKNQRTLFNFTDSRTTMAELR